MNFTVKNRYSETNLPDKHGRWARIVYANNLQIAWIKGIIIDDKLFYSVKDFFPSVHNDSAKETLKKGLTYIGIHNYH